MTTKKKIQFIKKVRFCNGKQHLITIPKKQADKVNWLDKEVLIIIKPIKWVLEE